MRFGHLEEPGLDIPVPQSDVIIWASSACLDDSRTTGRPDEHGIPVDLQGFSA